MNGRSWGAATLAACMLAGCSVGPEPVRSVVVVTIDTLRADRLGCYGNGDGLTPHLDALAADGVRFSDASAPAPITLPSHTSLFTGRYPTATAVRNNGTFVVPDDEITLAERFREAGWETGAVVAAFPLVRRFGLDQGFRIYDDDIEPPPGATPPKLRVHFVERDATAVTDRALGVWKSLAGGRRFLWVHYFDPHAPYAPPVDRANTYASPYDGEVAYVDNEIGRLLETVLADDPDAIVVVVADHGEALGDHDEMNHGLFVYQSTIHVPMIFRAPGRLRPGRTVDAPVSLVDVAPTLAGLAGLAALEAVDGADLAPLIAGEQPPSRPVYAESLMPVLEYRFSELRALRDGHWKYIDAPTPELYNLELDPGETRNLHHERAIEEQGLADRLRSFVAEAEESTAERATRGLDDETAAKLRSLGYITAGSSDVPTAGPGRDPKDMVTYFARHGEANIAFMENRFDDGLAILRELAAEAPENFMMHYHIGSALLADERWAEAEREFEVVVTAAPEFAAGYRLLARSQDAQGKVDAAVASYRAAAAAVPTAGRPLAELGTMLEGWGRFDAAAEAFREAIDREPDSADFARRLRELRTSRGGTDRAAAEMRELAERHPTSTALAIEFAIAERAAGRPNTALASLRHALDLEPGNVEALLEVGEIQLAGGNANVAETAYRRARELGPDRAEAHLGLARALLAEDRAADALRTLDRWIARDRASAPALALRGTCLERLGRGADALKAYEHALGLDPADPRARDGIVRLERHR